MGRTETYPSDEGERGTQAHLVIDSYFKDEDSAELYIHKDLVKVRDAWEIEKHVAPPLGEHLLGDVLSWVQFVLIYGRPDSLLTWNKRGLRAVLDFHPSDVLTAPTSPGRCQWIAWHPFVLTPEWERWMRLGNGNPYSQESVVELLENYAPDLAEGDSASLVEILRKLRAEVKSSAQTELRPDGTTKIEFTRESGLRADKETTVDLPRELFIAIPIIRGHLAPDPEKPEDGPVPVKFKMALRLRASVGNDAHLTFRFAIPAADRALEIVYADLVGKARGLLGADHALLRAAD